MFVSKGTDITKEQIAATLGGTNLFNGLGPETLDRIADICRRRDFLADDILYRSGDEAEDLYVLLSGRVNFMLDAKDDTRRSGSVISSRMVFGWAALIPEHPKRVATAVCIDPSTVLVIRGNELLALLTSAPVAGFEVMQRLAAMIARNFMEQGA